MAEIIWNPDAPNPEGGYGRYQAVPNKPEELHQAGTPYSAYYPSGATYNPQGYGGPATPPQSYELTTAEGNKYLVQNVPTPQMGAGSFRQDYSQLGGGQTIATASYAPQAGAAPGTQRVNLGNDYVVITPQKFVDVGGKITTPAPGSSFDVGAYMGQLKSGTYSAQPYEGGWKIALFNQVDVPKDILSKVDTTMYMKVDRGTGAVVERGVMSGPDYVQMIGGPKAAEQFSRMGPWSQAREIAGTALASPFATEFLGAKYWGNETAAQAAVVKNIAAKNWIETTRANEPFTMPSLNPFVELPREWAFITQPSRSTQLSGEYAGGTLTSSPAGWVASGAAGGYAVGAVARSAIPIIWALPGVARGVGIVAPFIASHPEALGMAVQVGVPAFEGWKIHSLTMAGAPKETIAMEGFKDFAYTLGFMGGFQVGYTTAPKLTYAKLEFETPEFGRPEGTAGATKVVEWRGGYWEYGNEAHPILGKTPRGWEFGTPQTELYGARPAPKNAIEWALLKPAYQNLYAEGGTFRSFTAGTGRVQEALDFTFKTYTGAGKPGSEIHWEKLGLSKEGTQLTKEWFAKYQSEVELFGSRAYAEQGAPIAPHDTDIKMFLSSAGGKAATTELAKGLMRTDAAWFQAKEYGVEIFTRRTGKAFDIHWGPGEEEANLMFGLKEQPVIKIGSVSTEAIGTGEAHYMSRIGTPGPVGFGPAQYTPGQGLIQDRLKELPHIAATWEFQVSQREAGFWNVLPWKGAETASMRGWLEGFKATEGIGGRDTLVLLASPKAASTASPVSFAASLSSFTSGYRVSSSSAASSKPPSAYSSSGFSSAPSVFSSPSVPSSTPSSPFSSAPSYPSSPSSPPSSPSYPSSPSSSPGSSPFSGPPPFVPGFGARRDWGGSFQGFGFGGERKKGRKEKAVLRPMRDVFTAEFEGLRTGKSNLKPLPQTQAVKRAFGAKMYGAQMPFMRFGPSDVPKAKPTRGKLWKIRI